MKKLIPIIILILSTLIILQGWEILSRFGLLPEFGFLLPSNNKIDETVIVVEEVKEIAQLLTQSYYDEIFFDTGVIKTSWLKKNKRLAVISEGIVKAGFDLKNFSADSIRRVNGQWEITLPPPKILSVTSNPSNKEIFIARGDITQADQNHVNRLINERIHENSIRNRILQKSRDQGIRTVKKLLQYFGMKDVVVRARKSGREIKAEEIIAFSRKRNYQGYDNLKSTSMKYNYKYMDAVSKRDITFTVTETMESPDEFHKVVHSAAGKRIQEFRRKGDITRSIRALLKESLKPILADSDRSGFIREMFADPQDYSFYFLKDLVINRSKYHVVYAFYGDKGWKKLFVNRMSGLIAIVEDSVRYRGQRELRGTFYSNFRRNGNLFIPFKAQSFIMNRLVSEMLITDLALNNQPEAKPY